jgi:membrane fusion protein (multidrug efflux system)
MPRSVAEKSKTDTFEPAAGESERLRVVESPAKPRPAPEPQPEPEPRPQAEPQPQPETPPEARDGKPEPAKKKGAARRFVLPVIGLVALAAGGYYGYHYWVDGRFMVGTDDAYVEADISYVAPKLAGYVAAVPVKENQHVKAGDVLLRLDDGDYRIALAQAEAQIATQHKTVERIAAQAEAADAQLEQAKAHRQASTATLSNAERTAARADQLVKTRVGT